ncbi:MAG: lamin tail domain-containing protein, partial [Mucilaginibacter polytrichastri]|nr:lamin tail domain-containing protein [Mucilaginibacter polytrichastri]
MRKFLLTGLMLITVMTYGQTVTPGSLCVSEIMFNPKPDGADFVEVYNPGPAGVDLSKVQIATVNSKDSVSAIKIISKNSMVIQPGEYRVFTTKPDNLRAAYLCRNPQWIVTVASLPAFANEKGTVLLLSGKIQIERFDYTSNMHHPLLKNEKGISLERSNFSRPANDRSNWHSAAATAGYATPTYKNSVAEAVADELLLQTKTFSPDGDGLDDELILQYNFRRADMLASISVYDLRGKLVNRLRKNETLGTNGSIRWNGNDETGAQMVAGPYILVFEGFYPDGGTLKKKL